MSTLTSCLLCFTHLSIYSNRNFDQGCPTLHAPDPHIHLQHTHTNSTHTPTADTHQEHKHTNSTHTPTAHTHQQCTPLTNTTFCLFSGYICFLLMARLFWSVDLLLGIYGDGHYVAYVQACRNMRLYPPALNASRATLTCWCTRFTTVDRSRRGEREREREREMERERQREIKRQRERDRER